MLDPSEENNRMKRKLTLNPFGVDYLPKFLRQTAATINGVGPSPVISNEGIQLLVDASTTTSAGALLTNSTEASSFSPTTRYDSFPFLVSVVV